MTFIQFSVNSDRHDFLDSYHHRLLATEILLSYKKKNIKTASLMGGFFRRIEREKKSSPIQLEEGVSS